MKTRNASIIFFLALLFAASGAIAQESLRTATAPQQVGADADKLAEKLSNPVASLISVPLQLDYQRKWFEKGDQWLLEIEPVIPVSISERWNMISRTIIPVVRQDDVIPGTSQSGVGDILQSFFFSPKAPSSSGWIWGAGPAIQIPIGGRDVTTDTWAVGPTAVVLKQENGWTYGALVNQLWDTGGSGGKDIDQLFLEPFAAKALGNGRTLSFSTETTYDWNSKKWNVPLIAGISKVTKWGKQMVSNGIYVKWYVTTPYHGNDGPDWGVRYKLTLLFPE